MVGDKMVVGKTLGGKMLRYYYYQYYVGVQVILMRLAQLSELPEDPEPSSSLGACILR